MISSNAIGLRTLFFKEIARFSKVWSQTVFSPLMTTSLYFLVFGVALGSRLKTVGGVPYIEYVVPGLIMLALINNAFLNTSSSLFQSKINGTIIDVLVAPLGAYEVMAAYVGAALVRALLVGSLVFAVAWMFTGMSIAHPLWTLYFAVTVASGFAALGISVALWADKYDHLTFVPNFLLTPLTFLGGVFYSVDMLPPPWRTLSRLNPIFYMVNGLRYALLGQGDVPVWQSALLVGGCAAGLLGVASWMVARGYNVRS